MLVGRLSTQAFAVLLDQAVCSATNFLTGVAVARGCPKAEYGVFVLFIIVLRFVAGIQNSMVGMPFTINHPRIEVDRRAVYLGNTLVSQLFLSGIVGVLFLVAAIVARFGSADPGTTRALDVLILASVAFIARDSLRLMLLGQLYVWRNLLLSAAVAVFTLGGLYAGQVRGALSTPLALAIIGMGAGVPTAGFWFVLQWRRSCVRRKDLWGDFLLNWDQGRWFTVRTFMYMVAFSLYPFYLRTFSSAEQVAAYGVCFSISSMANPIFMGMGAYLRPKFSHLAAQNERALSAVVVQVEVALGVVAVALVAMTAFFGESLIAMVYGAKYSGLGWPLVLTAIGVAFSIVELPLLSAAEALRNTKATFVARCCSSGFTLIGGLLLVKYRGLYGAVLGLTLSHAVGFLYLLGTLMRFRGRVRLAR